VCWEPSLLNPSWLRTREFPKFLPRLCLVRTPLCPRLNYTDTVGHAVLLRMDRLPKTSYSVQTVKRLAQILAYGRRFKDDHRPEFQILENTLFRKLVQWLRLALSKGPNKAGVSPPPSQLRTERDPVSETMCFLAFRFPDDGQSPESQWFWELYEYTIVRAL
jgi:hypothetical protein